MNKYGIFFFIFTIFAGNFNLKSQINYSDSLKLAAEMYEKGLFDKVFEFLPQIMKAHKFKGNELNDASKILISAAYEADEIEFADSSMLIFLKKYPIYIVQTNDPEAFSNSFARFKIAPRFSFGLKGGISKQEVDIIKKYSIWESADYSKSYKSDYSPVFKSFIKFHFSKKINLTFEFNFYLREYKRDIFVNDSLEINYGEEFREIKLPLILEYSPFEYRNFFPSVYVGTYVNFYNKPEGEFYGSSGSHQPKSSFFDTKDSRNLINYGATFGVGLNYKFKRFVFVADFMYSLDYLNFTKRDYNIITQNNIGSFYIDDVFKFRAGNISFGFYYIISYKVNKKW